MTEHIVIHQESLGNRRATPTIVQEDKGIGTACDTRLTQPVTGKGGPLLTLSVSQKSRVNHPPK
jgi:hypothetical protein